MIAPNIIVLDRIYKDFQGLRIFFEDPVIPDNGFDGRNWRNEFQLTLHLQDEVRITRPIGNIFLTNIHRVYAGDDIPASPDDEDMRDYFLGKQPSGATTDSKVDLGMIKAFVQTELFDRQVGLEDPNTLRNLSEPAATRTLIETFKKAINALTVQDKGDAEIRDTIKLRQTRSFVAKDQGYLIPKKSVFNRIIGDSHFELRFAGFLENCSDVVSYAKNYLAVHFKLDYVNADGDISNYYPDFLVKLANSQIVIVETKGREDPDVPLKMERLRQWCEDINRVQADVKYGFVYVDEESFEKYKPASFRQLLDGFMEYKEKK